jgi:hypothetical protein
MGRTFVNSRYIDQWCEQMDSARTAMISDITSQNAVSSTMLKKMRIVA